MEDLLQKKEEKRKEGREEMIFDFLSTREEKKLMMDVYSIATSVNFLRVNKRRGDWKGEGVNFVSINLFSLSKGEY